MKKGTLNKILAAGMSAALVAAMFPVSMIPPSDVSAEGIEELTELEVTEESGSNEEEPEEDGTHGAREEAAQGLGSYVIMDEPSGGDGANTLEISEETTSISFDSDNSRYDGSLGEYVPSVTVSWNGRTLTEGVHYTATFGRGSEEGKGTCDVKGMESGGFEGKVSAKFTFIANPNGSAGASSSELTAENTAIYLESYELDYTGAEIRPKATVVFTDPAIVKDGSFVMAEGEQYKVEYLDNVNPGKAEVIVTGIGRWSGSVSAHFTIKGSEDSPKAMTSDNTRVELDQYSFSYDGSPKRPAATVTFYNENGESQALTEGKHFTAEYEDNIEPGEAEVIVTGIAPYSGSVTASFAIESAPEAAPTLSNENTRIELDMEHYLYDGTPKRPGASVTFIDADGEEYELTEGKHFTVEYEDNVEPGEAKAVVTGISPYQGGAAASFTIADAPSSKRTLTDENTYMELEQDSMPYDGTPKRPKVSVTFTDDDGAEYELTEGKHFTVDYSNNVMPGEYAEAVARGISPYEGSVSAYFTIEETEESPKPMTEENTGIELDQESFTYDGSPKRPKPTVTYYSESGEERALTEGKDFSTSYANNVEPGEEAEVTVTGISPYEGSVTAFFTIDEAPDVEISNSNTKITLAPGPFAFNGSEWEPAVKSVVVNKKTRVDPSCYDVTYEDNVAPGEATVVVEAYEGTGFSGVATATFTIDKGVPSYKIKGLSAATITVGGKSEIRYEDPLQDTDIDADYEVLFASRASKIASVDPETGEITGKAPGVATFRLYSKASGNFKAHSASSSLKVTVLPAAPGSLSCKAAAKSEGVNLSWAKGSGATGYEIYRSDYQKGKKPIKKISGGNKRTWTDKSAAQGSKYTYTVKSTYKSGSTSLASSSGKSASYTHPVYVEAPKGLKGKSSSAGKVAYSWAKSQGASGYKIQYSSEKSFKTKGKIKTVTIKKGGTLKSTIKKLKSKKNVYARICSYKVVNKKSYDSSWSKTVSTKVK